MSRKISVTLDPRIYKFHLVKHRRLTGDFDERDEETPEELNSENHWKSYCIRKIPAGMTEAEFIQQQREPLLK